MPPRGVHRSAFSTRFESACNVRPGSARAPAPGSTTASSPTSYACDWGSYRETASSAISPRSTGCGVTENERPAQPGEVEQVVDQALEAVRLTLDHPSCPLGLDDAVGETFRMAADRRQRRLQLVADRQQERTLGVLREAKLVGELVERGRELSHLLRPLDAQRLRALARGQPPACSGHPRHGLRHRPRERERGQRGERGAHQPGQAEPDEERRPVRSLVAHRAEQDDRVAVGRARGVEKLLAAHLDGPVCGAACAQVRRSVGREQQLGLREREDGQALLLGREEAPDLRRAVPCDRRHLVLLRDQVGLAGERAPRIVVERPPRQQRADSERDGDRHGHGGGDPDEQARAERAWTPGPRDAHGTLL